MRLFRKLGVACVLSLCATTAEAASVLYTITDIGSAFNLASAATSINNSEQVAGWYFTASGYRSFVYDDATTPKFTSLNSLTAPNQAFGISDSGLVVGGSAGNVFAYGPGAKGPIGLAGTADAVNSAGEIVGVSNFKAFKSDGTTTTLLSLGGGSSEATGINSKGDIVGWTWINGAKTAFILPNGASTPITLAAPPGHSNLIASVADSISDDGTVVGYYNTKGDGSGVKYAFMYKIGDANVTLFDESFIPSEAKDVNKSGKVVGFFTVAGRPNGFIYVPGEGMLNLNDLIAPYAKKNNMVITGALSINDKGSIAATAVNVDENGRWGAYTYAIRLNFVPLPGSGLMGLGLLASVGGMGLIRRLRRAD